MSLSRQPRPGRQLTRISSTSVNDFPAQHTKQKFRATEAMCFRNEEDFRGRRDRFEIAIGSNTSEVSSMVVQEIQAATRVPHPLGTVLPLGTDDLFCTKSEGGLDLMLLE